MASNAKNLPGGKALFPWFLAFALVGGLVPPSIIRIVGPPRTLGGLGIVLFFWPTSILLITDPSAFFDKLVLYSLSLGLNAVLYGCFGLLLGFCLRGIRKTG